MPQQIGLVQPLLDLVPTGNGIAPIGKILKNIVSTAPFRKTGFNPPDPPPPGFLLALEAATKLLAMVPQVQQRVDYCSTISPAQAG
jgi:hypothetical protein